ncbi:hypothetical protein GALL_533710 [mine drainage metagenome]|uniref:Uncharacterized protein n=1 Tax=mine drainage metagenome TaxID=410659 RepID=A0A1J5PB92_9ZZZZ
MVTVAETVEARRSPSEIDDNKEKRGQRVEAEMGTEPRQSDRQHQIGRACRIAKQPPQGSGQRNNGHDQGRAIGGGGGDL